MAVADHYPQFMLSEPTSQDIPERRRVSDSSLLQQPRPRTHSRRVSSSSSVTTAKSSAISANSDSEELSTVSSMTSLGSTDSQEPLTRLTSTEPGPSSGRRPSSDSLNPDNVVSDKHLTPDGMLVVRTSCRYDCYCACHALQLEKPPKRFSGPRHRKQLCTEVSCLNKVNIGDQHVDYSRFFRKAVSQAVSSKTVKIRYSLGTFRLVPEGSDAMRYVKHGSLEKLQACIESGAATIWDTAPDGWSLLHVSLPYWCYSIGLKTVSGE